MEEMRDSLPNTKTTGAGGGGEEDLLSELQMTTFIVTLYVLDQKAKRVLEPLFELADMETRF